jgi:hypothetical protein
LFNISLFTNHFSIAIPHPAAKFFLAIHFRQFSPLVHILSFNWSFASFPQPHLIHWHCHHSHNPK